MTNIQKAMKDLFGGSCYGYCLGYLFGESKDIKYLTEGFLEGWKRGYIDDDGYVSDPLRYITMLCGTKYRDIEKPEIKTLSGLPPGNHIVELKNPNGGSHFVITNNKKELIFDPFYVSDSWKLQLPLSYRKYIL